MIVPTSRLLFWAAGMLPVVAAGAALPGAGRASLVLLALWLVLVLADVLAAGSRTRNVKASLPELVRLSKDRDGEINLKLEHENVKARRIRIGLPFPREIESREPVVTVDLPKNAPASHLAWSCLPKKRGRYFLENCYLEGTSPLGFWAHRRTVPVFSELRVYPNLLAEGKRVSALFLHRGGLGIHAQRQIGKGREFEMLREYLPGDSFQDIHWKAMAKRGKPVTKVFQIERTQEIYVIIDASRLSSRPAGHSAENNGVTILERFITAALIVGLAAQKQGDLFGLMTFSDKVGGFVRAKSGKIHYNSCRESLYTLEPRTSSPDFTEAFSFIAARLRKRALLLFLTNMDDPLLAESFIRYVPMIARRHLVLVGMISPPNARPLFSGKNVDQVDDLYRELGGHLEWTGLRETEKLLRRRNVGFHLLDNEKMCAQLVSQYMSVKQRQAL